MTHPFRPLSSPLLRKQTAALLLLTSALFLFAITADARISLEALRRDGYGVVELSRPHPNVLTVSATINGRKARLIVDSGWSGEGITLRGEFGEALRSPVQAVNRLGRSAGGYVLGNFKKGVADTVVLGNVQMRQVPIAFGTIGSLQHSYTRSNMNADGFIGSGFLSTCSGIIDLHNLRLYLRPPATGRRAVIGSAMKAQGLAEVPFHIVQTNCLVAVEINGAPGIMFVDTGATLAGVDERFVPHMKAKAYSSHVTSVDAAGVEAPTKLTTLSSFRIAGVNVRAPDLRIGRFGFYDTTHGKVIGLLGMDILGRNGTIIDFGQKKLYFYPL
ncbi:MAG: Aspartyl protease [Verrucomicrobiota bacterium]|jgi:predicted aspartyl protease